MPIYKWIAGGYDIDELRESEIWIQAQLLQARRPVAGRVPVGWPDLIATKCIAERMEVSVAAPR